MKLSVVLFIISNLNICRNKTFLQRCAGDKINILRVVEKLSHLRRLAERITLAVDRDGINFARRNLRKTVVTEQTGNRFPDCFAGKQIFLRFFGADFNSPADFPKAV